jgi:UDP-N-acetylmuramoyl-L-alanyl-D-glutamate--2,6-diaminopimelate ligase
MMGEVAGRLSDVVLLTADNPRTEDPHKILAQTESGLSRSGMRREEHAAVGSLHGMYVVIPDRRSAIRRALDEARPGDVVVIAGKGHEDYQIIGTTKHHFDDAEEVRNYLSAAGH